MQSKDFSCFKNHGYFSTCTLQNYTASKMFFILIISGITRLDNVDDNVNTLTLMDAVCSICQHEYITIFFFEKNGGTLLRSMKQDLTGTNVNINTDHTEDFSTCSVPSVTIIVHYVNQ